MEPRKVGLVLLPMWPTERPTLGIAYIAAAIREAGMQVSVFDHNVLAWNRHGSKGTPEDLWLWSSWLDWSEAFPFRTEILPQVGTLLDRAAEEIASAVEEEKLEALGFSVFATGLHATRYVTKRLRARFPELRIFWGGPEIANGSCEEDLSSGVVDALVFGEGERTVVELLGAWGKRLPDGPIAGVVIRGGNEPAAGARARRDCHGPAAGASLFGF